MAAIIKLFGFLPLVLFGDAAVFDRWMWLRRRITPGRSRTLDAGCGSGAFAIYAAKRGGEAVGISFDERKNETARKRAALLKAGNVRFVTGDLRRLDALAETLGDFDRIICFETIEHIKDDRKLLGDFSRILRPGGELLLTAPYKLYRRLPGDKVSETEDGGHVRWGYTCEEMKELLEEAGFAVNRCDSVTGVISQKLILAHRLLSRHLPHRLAWALVFPFRIFTLLDPVITKPLRYPYLSVAVAAVKK